MKLVVLDGPRAQSVHALSGEEIVVGRHGAADVSLKGDSRISRRHCRLRSFGKAWLAEDLGSENGTLIDGEPITAPTQLQVSSLLQVGRTRLLALANDEDAAAAVARAGLTFGSASGLAAAQAGGAAEPVAPGAEVAAHVHVVPAEDQAIVDVTVDARSGEMATVVPEDAPRLRQRLEAFHEVARAVAGQLEPQAMLSAVLDAVLRVVPADRGFVLELPEGGGPPVCVVARHRDADRAVDVRVSRTIVQKAVTERVGVLVMDAMADASLADSASIMAAAIRSALTVPLVDEDRVVALIHLDTGAARAFTKDDLELLAAMARQAELAIGNTRLFDELRRAYDDLDLAQDRLVQTEKLTAIGTMATSIAHDVGNVLTPIRAIARKVMRDDTMDPRLREAFERQMQRLQALTQQLLSFSRPAPPTLVPLDLNEQVTRSLDLVATEARHADVRVATELAPDLPPALADGNRLDQVLINLAINAVHAMADGGGSLTFRTRAGDGTVMIDVVDTGCGIPPDKVPRIFEPFFTTKGQGGTGMGLYSCRRIVEEEHRGSLTLESVVGEGTTFTVSLPQAP